MYEGEWVDDVARCGVFSDIPAEFLGVGVSRAKAPEDHFVLPTVGHGVVVVVVTMVLGLQDLVSLLAFA